MLPEICSTHVSHYQLSHWINKSLRKFSCTTNFDEKMAQLREIIPEAEFAEQAGELDVAENILTRIFVIVFD